MQVGSRLALFVATVSLLGGVALGAPPQVETRKNVRVLATGGTIAGAGSNAGPAYRSGVVSIAEILRSIPGLDSLATISSEQVSNVGSFDVDEIVWRKLLGRVRAAIADPSIAGVVITHGTDTLEETAFFLSLVIPSAKPVVVVGAMRPGTAVSADGPHNLLDAVRVAISSEGRNRGVLVVMNDTIFEAASVTKTDIRRVNAFAAPIGGPVGDVLSNVPRFYRPAVKSDEGFAVLETPLPRVAVAYAFAGVKADDIRAAAAGAQGLIIAGMGAGSLSGDARRAVRELALKGVPVVRTARQGSGDVWTAVQAGNEQPGTRDTVAGRELSPAKARILLMLALQKPRSREEIQSLFNHFGIVAR